MTSHYSAAARAPRAPAFRRPSRHRLGLSLLAALLPTAALAEAPLPDAKDLDKIVVTGERESNYTVGRTSTGTRLELTPRETPQSISVVSRSQMDDFGLTSVNEVLDATTGVNVEAVETERTYYTARGFDIVNFQRDGLGVPLAYGLQNGDLDTALYQRVEVLRGANGLMSSTGNPSATVNFVRKRPTANFQGATSLTAGSWDTWRLDVDVSGALTDNGAVRGRAVAAFETGESYLDFYSHEKQVYYGVIEADLGPATLLTVGASYQRNRPDAPLWGALPLFYSDGTPTDYDVSTSTAARWAFWDTDDYRAFVELDQELGGDWSLRASLNYEKIVEDSQLFYTYGYPDPETGLGLFSYPSDYEGVFEAAFADVYATGTVELFGRDHDVVVGANWADGRNQEVSWFDDDIGTPLPPLEQWDGYYPKPEFDLYSDGSDFDYKRQSLYATVRWNLADDLKLITGANRTQVETEGVGYGNAPYVSDETRTSPFAGAVWDFSEHLSAYASYAEIFAPQTEADASGQPLDPLTGDNAEIGIKGAWFDNRLNASLTAFKVHQYNLANYIGFNLETGQSIYAGIDAGSQGFEFDISGRLTENWQISAGYTDLTIENPQGEPVRSYVPRELLRVATVWQALPQLRLGASLDWQSDIHREIALTDASGQPLRIEQDAYALLDLMARYDFAENWHATLNLDNVTDEKYIPSLYWEQGYYAAPRNWSLTVGYRF
jgi:outer membrane receptor for ferric coprogen and ferric-rhodotorulic acid